MQKVRMIKETEFLNLLLLAHQAAQDGFGGELHRVLLVLPEAFIDEGEEEPRVRFVKRPRLDEPGGVEAAERDISEAVRDRTLTSLEHRVKTLETRGILEVGHAYRASVLDAEQRAAATCKDLEIVRADELHALALRKATAEAEEAEAARDRELIWLVLDVSEAKGTELAITFSSLWARIVDRWAKK